MNRSLLLCLFVVLFTSVVALAQAAKVVNIGVIIDGPTKQQEFSPDLFKNELLALTKGEFDVRFPNDKQLDGGWSAKHINSAIKQLQDDPNVDMVLAFGYVASQLAAISTPLRKPTFAPFVFDADLLDLPRKANTSGVKNLNYITGDAEFARDLEIFRNVVAFKNVAVLIDNTSFEALPQVIERARKVAAADGVDLFFVTQTMQDEDLVAKLPKKTDAVVVTSVPRLNEAGMKQLIEGLIEKRLPSYSFVGSQQVEQGLLASDSPASDLKRIARRNALNMQAVMRGEAAGNQPVSFKAKRQLTINMATARAIGVFPRFDVLNEAILINEEPKPKGRPLSLSGVAHQAIKINLDLRASTFGLEAGQAVVDESRAQLLPQLNVGVGYAQFNNDSLLVKSGAVAEQATTAAITINQLIYSDKVRANIEIQRYLQNNREALYRQLELDIIQETTTAYLNVLKSQTLVRIAKENMNLTRANLELARDRRRVGVANPAEVYRWESELATSRQGLLLAQSNLQQARDALNRILHRPLKENFITEPATLDDPALIVSRPELFEYVNNDRNYELMGDFIVQEGLKASPELAALAALTSATERKQKTDQRAYWSPSVTFEGEVNNILDENRVANVTAEGDTNWMIGLNVSLPLFEGGARSARLTGSRSELDRFRSEQDATRERIEQRIRNNLHRIRASYPSIRLSKHAADAAGKNLNLVIDAYSRGAVSILDLLDAQNAALVAEVSAANAVLNFLIDLMNLERSAGQFDFFLDDRSRDEWFDRLKNYIATEGKE